MATIIDDGSPEVVREVHHDHYGDGGGAGTLIGVILAILLIAILLFYGLPLFRRAMNRTTTTPNTINVNLNANPSGGAASGGTTPAP